MGKGKQGMLELTGNAERTREIAERTLALMARYQVAPLPRYYEIWFTYAAGLKPDLSQTLEAWMRNQSAFDASFANDLYQRFVQAPPGGETMEEIGRRINAQLEQLQQSVQAAGRDASAYGSTLQGAAGALGSDGNLGGIRSVVDNLVHATRDMQRRNQALESRLQESSVEIQTLRESVESVRKQSLTDALTGLGNRKYFDERLDTAIQDGRNCGLPVCLLLGDIDRFKTFNDTWGHQTGDQVLRLVARALSENVKGRDTPARYGGEEFAVILCQTALKDAVMLANRIRQAVEAKKVVRRSTGETLSSITISFGAALLGPSDTAASFIERADSCLYAAKHAGRNCVRDETQMQATAPFAKASAVG